MIKRLAAVAAAPLLLLGVAACGYPWAASTGVMVDLELTSSSISREFAAGLPTAFSFSDRMGTAQVAPLTTPLDGTDSVAESEFRAGDVAYWARDHVLVVFLSDNSSARAGDLYLLGHITSELEDVAGCVRDCRVQLAVDGEVPGSPATVHQHVTLPIRLIPRASTTDNSRTYPGMPSRTT